MAPAPRRSTGHSEGSTPPNLGRDQRTGHANQARPVRQRLGRRRPWQKLARFKQQRQNDAANAPAPHLRCGFRPKPAVRRAGGKSRVEADKHYCTAPIALARLELCGGQANRPGKYY